MNKQMKYKKKIIFFFSLFFIFYSYTWSDTRQGLNRNETIEENRKNLLEREEGLEEVSAKEAIIQREDIVKKESDLNLGGIKSIFKQITLEGEHPLKRKLKKEADTYLQKEMTEKSIQELISYLSKYLSSKGYATSLVTFHSGNIYQGNITLNIKAGKIRDIYFAKIGKECRSR